jgi:spermidine synthase
MKPTTILAQERTAEGATLVLSRRDTTYTLTVDGQELMSSRAHGSEEALARRTAAAIADQPAPRVLIGGLGFGYTLRAALDSLPAAATVVLCEVFPALVTWNRSWLATLAGEPLADPRVSIVVADVRRLLKGEPPFDAIILDVDNGPEALTLKSNEALYSLDGLARLGRALAPRGMLAVWSTAPAPAFEARLRQAGFAAWSERVPARVGAKVTRGQRHTLFLARRE